MTRVLLLGRGPTALSALESLVQRFHVLSVVRDVPDGAQAADAVAVRAAELAVPLVTDTSLATVERLLRELHPDCTVVSSYDRILGPDLLGYCPFINVHYAPLPQYRGRATVNWALINGESHAAISIHVLVPALDAGNILFQKRVPIGPDTTTSDLYVTLNDLQRAALADTVALHLGGYAGEPQDETAATFACTRLPRDGQIDWSQSTDEIFALIRALDGPYPSAHTYLDTVRLSIVRAEPVRNPPRYVGRIPGRVAAASRRDGHADVLTGDGLLRIQDVSVGDDPRVVTASTVITSLRQTLGLSTEDLLRRITALEAQIERLTSGRD
jgi:methionyl-tRNA formyltransferase